MGIFLRQSYNVKPPRWGSPADIEYAIKVNAEKVYDVDPDSIVLAMPLFWGLPCLDYSGKRNDGVNHGAYYKDGELEFDGSTAYIDLGNVVNLTTAITLSIRMKTSLSGIQIMISKWGNIGGGDINQSYSLALITGAPRLAINAINGTDLYTTTNETVDDGQSHYIVGTADNNTYNHKIYIDGILKKTEYYAQEIIKITTDPLQIGLGSTYFFNGSIFDVRIANVARTADQTALFHALPYGLYQPVIRRTYYLPIDFVPRITTLL